MSTNPDHKSPLSPDSTTENRQEVGKNQGQAINQMVGEIVIGQLTIYLSHVQTEAESPQPDATKLGDNPYRGLLAFRETDGDRFFGRETQIEQLWQKFCHLHEDKSTVRVLPIYGPSGSGKSSLARAGLIPALAKRPLPGRAHARLAVLVPGTHPLEALAMVLARIATNDPTPVEKSQEFERVLKTKSDEGNYEGLRRIANALPDIDFSPLIVLVDQFEEVYTYALSSEQAERDAFIAERDAFIENLLCAAAEPTKRVSVILTLRSDFLGDTQQHPRLNKLFSSQGFLVPIMQPEELEIAITKPAEQAGYKLDKAIVTLLVEQTQGREGTLPLLQFALTRIWEGLQNGVDPADTLDEIGGVGGALAGEAQRLYESLSSEEQAIARSIFLALVQVSEDSGDTRRRAVVSELIANDADEVRVWSIIYRFAEPRVRFLVIFSDKQYGEMIEMIEVAHEALIRNWKQLKDWLNECREALRRKRKIEDAAEEWKYQKKSKDYLLQGRSLRDAREFMQATAANKEIALSSLAVELVKASHWKQRSDRLKFTGFIIVFPLIATLLAVHLQIINRAKQILTSENCKPDNEIQWILEYMWWTGYKSQWRGVNLCKEMLIGIELPDTLISNSNFEKANFSGANFKNSSLVGTNFRGASLVGINFENALLMNTDFRCSDECTDLVGANMKNANLSKANLQNAFLLEANLNGAILTDAFLDGAKDLTVEQLRGAKLCRTLLPKYLSISGDRDCPKSQQNLNYLN
jgi:uncharacterized protein YjbI with pentapeptide repeats